MNQKKETTIPLLDIGGEGRYSTAINLIPRTPSSSEMCLAAATVCGIPEEGVGEFGESILGKLSSKYDPQDAR